MRGNQASIRPRVSRLAASDPGKHNSPAVSRGYCKSPAEQHQSGFRSDSAGELSSTHGTGGEADHRTPSFVGKRNCRFEPCVRPGCL